jgi:hypothetical protein
LPTAPNEVNWSGLSPRGREALGHIAMRMSAGYTSDEIAAIVEAERERLQHLPLPRFGQPVSRAWIAAQLHDLRAELREVSD